MIRTEQKEVYQIMVSGHLRERDGIYYMVLSYTDEDSKRHTPCRSTHLPVKGNKKRAEAMLDQLRRDTEETLRCQKLAQEHSKGVEKKPIFFTAFMTDWLNMMKSSLEVTTYAAYEKAIRARINAYFDQHYPKLLLQEVTPRHIQAFYSYEIEELGIKPSTVLHHHANIRKALQYAYKTDLIPSNPADKVQRPKKNACEANPYNSEELEKLFELVKGTQLELGVLFAAFYGLRRGEIVGLKWDAIDFTQKTITIRHTVTQATVDGKSVIIAKDGAKTKTSRRSLPLVAPFEKYLKALKKRQAENRLICGESYCQDYLDYVYVNDLGELVKPGYLTQAFPDFLEKHGMRRIRFHDLRHSCASLLYANGVALKDIQVWLGHSDIGTTSNIYTHLSYSSKVSSAQAILGILPDVN